MRFGADIQVTIVFVYYFISLLCTGHHDHRLGYTATYLEEMTFEVAKCIKYEAQTALFKDPVSTAQ